MSSETINVLIVDDSAVSRELLSFILESDPQIKIMASAQNGEEALEFLKTNTPDVVVLDIVMPKMNGFELTKKIMETKPIPIIVVSGIYSKEEVIKGFQAIEAGALAILEKPNGVGSSQYLDTARFVIQTIKALSAAKVAKENAPVQPVKPADVQVKIPKESLAVASISPPESLNAVAIGSSIGGPQSLCTILAKLPASFPAPIFIAQHISGGLIQGLICWLQESTKLKVELAKHGEKALPGHVYLPPDHYNMEISEGDIIQLQEDSSDDDQVPSIAKLFKSVAHVYGPHAAGVILTGIGGDGADELLLMKMKGATTIAQDEESSIMFDMPKHAIELNAATLVEPLGNIAAILEKLAEKTASASCAQEDNE